MKGGLFTKGIVVEVKGRHAIALSKDGTFLKVGNRRNLQVGCEIDLDSGAKTGINALARVSSIAAVFLFALGVGYGAYCYTTPYSYVGVDINPSVELTTNMFDRIIDAKALNADGKKLLDTTGFHNIKIDKAVKALLSSAVKQGYLKPGTENTVVLSVSSKDDAKSENLVSNLEGTASGTLEQEKVTTDLVVDRSSIKEHEKAKKTGVTTGKLNLMEEAVKTRPGLKLEDLKGESVKDMVDKYGAAIEDEKAGNGLKTNGTKIRTIKDGGSDTGKGKSSGDKGSSKGDGKQGGNSQGSNSQGNGQGNSQGDGQGNSQGSNDRGNGQGNNGKVNNGKDNSGSDYSSKDGNGKDNGNGSVNKGSKGPGDDQDNNGRGNDGKGNDKDPNQNGTDGKEVNHTDATSAGTDKGGAAHTGNGRDTNNSDKNGKGTGSGSSGDNNGNGGNSSGKGSRDDKKGTGGERSGKTWAGSDRPGKDSGVGSNDQKASGNATGDKLNDSRGKGSGSGSAKNKADSSGKLKRTDMNGKWVWGRR